MTPKKKSTDYLKRRGASPGNAEFREKILDFLAVTNADNEIEYSIQNDLSKKMDHPFYGIKKIKVKITRTPTELMEEYCRLLMLYDDQVFAKKLFQALNSQQTQTFRKLPLRSKSQLERKKRIQQGVWEHPIPAKCVVQEIVRSISEKNESRIKRVISVYQRAGIVFLSKEDNNLVNIKYRDRMPDNWCWDDDVLDAFVRYRLAGIDFEH